MQAMDLLRLSKRHISRRTKRHALNSGSCSYLLYQLANSKEIKPVAIAIIELRLSERISKGVSQSVSHAVSRKFD